MLGLNPVIMSGAGWVDKEDGENENILCQLKSTDADSIRINKLDLEKLEYHSSVSHKLPLFIIQFLEDDSLYAVLPISELDKYIDLSPKTQVQTKVKGEKSIAIVDEFEVKKPKIKKSSAKSRNSFFEGREKQWKKQK